MRSFVRAVLILCALLGVFVAAGFSVQQPAAPRPALSLPEPSHFALQHMEERLGLATITVTGFTQDKDGFLWIGTQDGLLRFDGVNITTFGKAQGLPNTVIDQLIVAPDGAMWVGTEDGLARFDGSTFRPLSLPKGLQINATYELFGVDPSNAVYVGTSSGLLRLDPKNPSTYRLWTVKDGLLGNNVEAVYANKNGAIYFVTGNHVGVLESATSQPRILSPPITPRAERAVAVLVDGAEVLWVRTASHLMRLDPGKQAFVADDQEIPKANDFGMPSLSQRGDLLLPTVNGLFVHTANHWVHINQKQGLSTDACFAAFEDREGAIWVGYGGRGFDRWPGWRSWSAWTQAEGLPDDVVWSELRDSQGRLWVATNKGLALWDSVARQWRTWTENSGLAGNTVRELAIGKDGAVWALSFPGGLTRFDAVTLAPKKITMTPSNTPDPTGMGVAPDGTLWLGNEQYLKKLHNGTTPAIEDVALPKETVVGSTSHLIFTSDGTLWASGRAGIARYDGKTWSHFTKNDGLRSDVVSCLVAANANEVWLCYDQSLGVGHLKLVSGKPKLEHFDVAQGLRSSAIAMVALDHLGQVWAGSEQGLSVIDPTGKIHSLTRADGLIWDDISSAAFLPESDGSVLVGTSGGLARFDPQSAPQPPKQVKVLLTSVVLGRQERLGQTEAMADHKNASFSVAFAAMTLRDPQDVTCHYRLAGLEGEFIETKLRQVQYSSLPAGSYGFTVACRAPDGDWSLPASFAFSVQPAWWETSWAHLAEFILVLLLAWGMGHLRTRSLRAERSRLEAAVTERSAELARANQELQEAALTDPLTNVRNRRFFASTIVSDAGQALRAYSDAAHSTDHRDLVFYLVDVDHFKYINDVFGHHAGDIALNIIAQRLTQVVRRSDMLIRWGGEEFLLVSRSAERRDAHILAERILAAVASEPLQLEDGKSILRTCSLGWAAFPWSRSAPDALSVEDVISLVDRALYIAKNSGRNQAIGFSAAEPDEQGAAEILEADGRKVHLTRIAGPRVSIQEAATAAQN